MARGTGEFRVGVAAGTPFPRQHLAILDARRAVPAGGRVSGQDGATVLVNLDLDVGETADSSASNPGVRDRL